MGYTGGRSMLHYYIQPKRKMRPSKKTVRFETQPGYQLQHDWGEGEAEVAGQRCRVNFAVNTLGFSRRLRLLKGIDLYTRECLGDLRGLESALNGGCGDA
ncbi:UNVERIFIED_ORG: transposase [Pantoea agglomerans]